MNNYFMNIDIEDIAEASIAAREMGYSVNPPIVQPKPDEDQNDNASND